MANHLKTYLVKVLQPYEIVVHATSAEAALAEVEATWIAQGLDGAAYTQGKPAFKVEEQKEGQHEGL